VSILFQGFSMPSQPLPRVVVVLGLVSFCNDLASEMVTPLIPILLAAVLGAGPVALGMIEGGAEAIAAWFKLWSGRRSDLWGGRRKPFVLGGYLLSNLVRPLMGLVTSWGMVAGLRGMDRVGKGLRAAPRDALIGDATAVSMRGRAYGLLRALDNGGAMGGALLAAACLAWTPLTLTQIILLSAVPGLAGVALVAFAVRDMPLAALVEKPLPPPILPRLSWRDVAPRLRPYLLVLGLFTLARASETFIVLRGHELKMTVSLLLLLWAAMSLAKAVAAWCGGHWSDRFGHGRLVLLHWVMHGASFLLLAGVRSVAMLWVAALVYGLLAGLGEGAERALVDALSDNGNGSAGKSQRGTSFGWYNLVLGVAAIPAGLLFGSLWQQFDAATAFASAGLLAWCAAWLLYRKVLND
jgi:MFS family permease